MLSLVIIKYLKNTQINISLLQRIKEILFFWYSQLNNLNNRKELSKYDINLINKTLMDTFWLSKGLAKEKYTPKKYKDNISIK
ncbi:hypothetical protein [Clostridium disporicum]|jgi:hypothetical protein|uniref:Uncharacterized protein n=1 Tax=Clostridium disporicum TaxID=84024 RepID=A0A174DKX7_9CLOT|nr:hypothetical protein [Clostridium disporicum]CUO24989.1 Uncharacterised protein [Clostridium disporicum]